MLIYIFVLGLVNTFSGLVTTVIPNPGSVYQKKIYIPIVGKQIIETEIISNNFAFIRLEGIINEQGTAKYIYSNDRHFIKYSLNLRKIIKKYKTELSFPYYDIENDELLFNLNVKVINFKSKIRMVRIK